MDRRTFLCSTGRNSLGSSAARHRAATDLPPGSIISAAQNGVHCLPANSLPHLSREGIDSAGLIGSHYTKL